MASGAILFCILLAIGLLSVHCTDKSTEQTGLYFEKQPEDIIGLRGESVMLPCSGRSVKNKDIKLMWLHNGSPVIPDGRRRVLSNGTLLITKILHKKSGFSDQGEYRCVISDGNGHLSSVFATLTVPVMPTFTEHPKSQNVQEGTHVQMFCEVDIYSDVMFTWEHNDYTLPERTEKHFILSGPGINGSIIYIFNVGLEDEGKYRCKVSSRTLLNERQSRRAVLTIKSKETSESTKFLSVPHVKMVKKGDFVSIDCVVDRSPFPVLSWRFQKKSQNSSIEIFNSTNTGHNIVFLENVTHEQSGLYICGSSTNSTMTVELKVMTRPQFTETPETIIYQAARAVRFRCKVVGDPVPMIVWLKDGYPLTITGRIAHNTRVDESLGLRSSEMLVASSLASDAGIYQCMAKNPVGMIWAASRLILNATKPAPKPPEKVSCHTISSTEIEVHWDISPELLMGGIKAFTIHYYDIDGGEELREAVSPTNRSIVVRSLIPYTNYTFYLRSYINSASDFSEQVACQTGEEVPKAAPVVQLLNSTSNSLEITWSPLDRKQARGEIIEYKIQWRLSGSPSNNVDRVNSSVLKYEILDLLPGNEYEVRILAATSKGWPTQNFPWTKFRLIAKESPGSLLEPNLALQAVNSTTIKVVWNFRSDALTKIRGYKLFYQKENGTVSGPILLHVNHSEYYITNLDPGTSYQVTLLGFTDVADGKSRKNTIRTPLNQDSLEKRDQYHTSTIKPPHSLHAEPLRSDKIILSWSPPLGDFDIKGYTVCYSAVQTSLTTSQSAINCLKSSNNTISITNLEPYTLYEFKIRTDGVHDVYSEYSNSIECYTQEDVPSHVINVRWRAENKTSVFISWEPPEKLNGIIRSYVIYYSQNSTVPVDSWATKVLSANTYSTHLTDLIPNTEYFFVIRASTAAGLGPYGKPKQIIIPVLMGATSKIPKKRKDRRNEQYVGIVVGLGIGLTSIIACTLCIICRRRCVKYQASDAVQQPCSRLTNGCAVREIRTDNQETEFFRYISNHNDAEEGIDFQHMLNSKGRLRNGILNGMKKPLSGDVSSSKNVHRGNIHITENPKYDASYGVSPLLSEESPVVPFRSDLSYDSDIQNHSQVPLLIGKRKLNDSERNNDISLDESACNRDRRKSSSRRRKKDNNVTEEESSATDRMSIHENSVLENPDFRFSDSDKAPSKNKDCNSPQHLYDSTLFNCSDLELKIGQ